MTPNELIRHLAGPTAMGALELAQDLNVSAWLIARAIDTDAPVSLKVRSAVAEEIGLLTPLHKHIDAGTVELEAERRWLLKRIKQLEKAQQRVALRDYARRMEPRPEPVLGPANSEPVDMLAELLGDETDVA